MTLKQLSKYHDMKIEVDDLKNRIEELESTIVKASKFSDMKVDRSFSNTSPTEQLVIKLEKLKNKYNTKSLLLLDEMERIEAYLDTINDNEVRTIMRKRFIDLMTWEEVAMQMHYSNPVPYYKVRKFLNE
jgi:predicted nuclease with TOPRIM domain